MIFLLIFYYFWKNGDKQDNKNISFKISKSFKNSLSYSPQINENIYINNEMTDTLFYSKSNKFYSDICLTYSKNKNNK